MNFVDKLFKIATECHEILQEEILNGFMDSIKKKFGDDLPSQKDINELYLKYLKDNKIERIVDDKGDTRYFKEDA